LAAVFGHTEEDWTVRLLLRDKRLKERDATKAQKLANAGQVAYLARTLRTMVDRVSAEEFYWQDVHYDNDSKSGRELLFLSANHEWVRATSESVDVSRSDSVETEIKLDIDLGRITHEAFRARKGHVWLPVTLLPPQRDQKAPRSPVTDSGRASARFDPDPFATVTDATGNLLPILPNADLRHQISAAMAEIIVNMAVAHWPGPAKQPADRVSANGRLKDPPLGTRDERLLLSAALYRMLQRNVNPHAEAPDSAPVIATPRIKVARELLLVLLEAYTSLLEAYVSLLEVPPDGRAAQFAPVLAWRAVKVLQALDESVMIVVPVSYDTAPTVLTVRVPARHLHQGPDRSWLRPRTWWIWPWTWVISPTGHLEIDMLLPTADADRQIQLRLPDGVSLMNPGKRPERGDRKSRHAVPQLQMVVTEPPSLQDLSASIGEVLSHGRDMADSRRRENGGPLLQSLVDLARVKVAIALDTMRHYQGRNSAGRRENGEPLLQSLVDLARVKVAIALDTMRHYLRRNSAGRTTRPGGDRVTETASAVLKKLDNQLADERFGDSQSLDDLKVSWEEFKSRTCSLARNARVDFPSPRAAVARTDMIESVSQRAFPTRARLCADVAVDDRDYFSIARSSGVMSLALMLVVLAFLIGWRHVRPSVSPAPEVLAIVLTLFAAIQAGRIERPDRSTLRGQLTAIGNTLIAFSVFPPVALAIALAFRPGGSVAEWWTGVSLLAQLTVLLFMWRGPLTPGRSPGIGRPRSFQTDEPDYSSLEALRSDYWQNTTADALMIGRPAYGYVVWQTTGQDTRSRHHGDSAAPQLRSLLTWPKAALTPISVAQAGADGRPGTSHDQPGDATANSGRAVMPAVAPGDRAALAAGLAGLADAPDEASSVLALLHSGTHGQAATFVVFRGKRPDNGWPKGCEVHPVDLDPGRLAPMDSITGTVDVFVGVPNDRTLLLATHPLFEVLKAAAKKLIVLEVQLPVPEPVRDNGGRRWARIRVAVRDKDDIHRLTGFLTEVEGYAIRHKEAGHIVAVQTIPAVDPIVIGIEEENSRQRVGNKTFPTGNLICDKDLDVVNSNRNIDEPPDSATWRLLVICADARSNVEYDIVQQVARVGPAYRLAGITYALLHGKAVIVLLAHDPEGCTAGMSEPQLERRLRSKPGLAKLQLLVYKNLSRIELGRGINTPLLRVRFRSQDRPGASADVLDSIREAMLEESPRIRPEQWSVPYALVKVASGRLAVGHFTIRLESAARHIKDWDKDQFKIPEIERKVMTRAVPIVRMDQGIESPQSEQQETMAPVISMRLIRRPQIALVPPMRTPFTRRPAQLG
jgi:hypothetical protein